MSNREDPQQLRDRIELVSENRYCTDPVCREWVNSGESVKILVGCLLERSDQYHAALLKSIFDQNADSRPDKMPRIVGQFQEKEE